VIRFRLAALLPFAALAAVLGTIALLVLANRGTALLLAKDDSPQLTWSAGQLAADHQRLYATVLEVRAGAPAVSLRRDYEAFAARVAQLRALAEGNPFSRLPGFRETLDEATLLTARLDVDLADQPADQAPAAAVADLMRGLPSLRDPLAELVRTVNAAQTLALSQRLAALDGMRRNALMALLLLGASLVLAGLMALIATRQVQSARMTQTLLQARASALRAEAGAAVRGRLEVLAFVADEIHARVSGVTGTLGRAQDTRDLDGRAREALVAVRAQAEDLLMLATDLSDLARIETGELRLQPAPFRLHDALEQAADLLRHRFRGPAHSIEVTLAEGAPDWWLGDAARIRQLLHHLGAAAVDAAAGGRARIAAHAEAQGESGAVGRGSEAGLTLVLVATGHPPVTALPPGSASPPGVAKATGTLPSSLALTLAETLTVAMGGSLARATDPEGARFTLRLGLATAATPEAAPEAAPRTGPLDILVVDDVALNRRLLGAVLERFGHRCEMAADGLEALGALQQRRFDLVLMDVQMPNLDGLAATRMVRALPPPAGLVPVIAVTAAVLPAERQACIAAGMDAFLAKPVATADLLAAIATVTAGREGGAQADALPAEAAVGPLMDTQTQAILRSTLTPEEFTRLVAETEAEAQTGMRALDAAAAAGDSEALAREAAAMAALCEGIGGLRVVAIARALEAAAVGGRRASPASGTQGAARAAAHLPALKRALGETLTGLNRRLPQARDASSSGARQPAG
jgi:CheY-like chemotaxis protein